MALCTRCGRQTEGAAEFCSGCASHSGANDWGRPQAVPAATATADYLRPFAPESSASPPLARDGGSSDWAAPRHPLSQPAESEEWAFPSPSGRLPDFPPLPRVPYDARRGSDAYRADSYQPDSYRADGYRPDAYPPDAYRADSYQPDAYRVDSYQPDVNRADGYGPDADRPDGYQPDADRPHGGRPAAYQPERGGLDPHPPDPEQADEWRPDREAPRGPFTPAGPPAAAGPPTPGAGSFAIAPTPFPPPDQARPAAFVRPSGLLPGGYSDDDRYPAGDSYQAGNGHPADGSSPGPAARLRWSASPAQLADPLGSNGYQAYDPGQPADSDRPVPEQLAAGQFAPSHPAAEQFTADQFTPARPLPEQFTPGAVTPSQVTPGQFTPSQFTPSQFTPGQFTPDQNGAGQNGPAQALGQTAMPPSAWTAPAELPAARLPLDAATAPGPSDTGILPEPGWREATKGVPPPDADQDPTDSAASSGSRYPSHPPSARVKSPRAQGQHNGRWVSIAAAAVVLVICVVTAAILLSRGKPAPKGSPRAAITHSPRSTAAPVVNGLVTIDPAAAGESSEPAVVSFLSRYFTAINHHDFAAYRLLFSTSLRGGLSSAAFGRGYGTSRDSLVTLHTISAAGTAELDAAVTFTSRQRPAASPTHSACTAWVISLYLVQQGDGYVLVSPPAGYEASFSDCS